MGAGYAKSTLTLAALTATRLSAALLAEGYTGSMIGKYLNIDSGALGDVFRGADSTVDDATGVPVPIGIPFVRTAAHPRLAVDPGGLWLYSISGGDITVTFLPF